MSDFCSLTHIKKTRRERICDWCGESIPAGSTAWKTAGCNQGEFWKGHLHPECVEANQRLTPAERDELRDGWEPGEFMRGMTPRESRQSDNAINYWAR